MRRKTSDPELIRLLDAAHKEHETFERWYRRTKAAFMRMEKSRQKLVRLARLIDHKEQGY